MDRKKIEEARKKQIGDGMNKKILDKGRMINDGKKRKMKQNRKMGK